MGVTWTKGTHLSKYGDIGDFTYGHIRVEGNLRWLRIGKYTSIGPNVRAIIDGYGHVPNRAAMFPFSYPEFAVHFPKAARYPTKQTADRFFTIGNDCWICTDVIILKNVTIGDGAYIGAGAVISRDVPPYTLAVGNPCVFPKRRYHGHPHQEEIIRSMLKIKWWNWPTKKIQEDIEYFYDPKEFIKNNLQ
ncbi:CatB-related O-acetyltransferase [Candidatus Pacearchaeota archaeon]|nr:CatB-related O-acetyltransferase [Candidatus Pacearchaeota archaeon]